MEKNSDSRGGKFKVLSIEKIEAILELNTGTSNKIMDIASCAENFEKWAQKSLGAKSENYTARLIRGSSRLKAQLYTDKIVGYKTVNSLVHFIFFISKEQKQVKDKLIELFQELELIAFEKSHKESINEVIVDNIKWAKTEKESFIKFDQSWAVKIEDHLNKTVNATQVSGTITVDEAFYQALIKGTNYSPEQFYMAKFDPSCQWYGVAKTYDVQRKEHEAIKEVIVTSFENYRNDKVCAIVHGTGGSGKSTLLRRLALELRNSNFTLLWVEDGGFDEFTKNGFQTISNNPTTDYLLFIEDWYRLAGSNQNAVSRDFFNQLRKQSNIQVIIGDRVITGKPYFKHLYNLEYAFELDTRENEAIIKAILNIQQHWKDTANRLFTNSENLKSPIFLLLFVLARTYQEGNKDKSLNLVNPENEFKRIIASDVEFIYSKYPGLAKMLFYLACMYEKHRLFISYSCFLKLSDHFNPTKNVFAELSDFKSQTRIHDRLRLYVHIITQSFSGKEDNYIKFNHDLFADLGISKISNYIEDIGGYDDIAKRKIVERIISIKDEKISVSRLFSTFIHSEQNIFTNETEINSYIHLLLDDANYHFTYLNSLRKVKFSVNEKQELINRLKRGKQYPTSLWCSAILKDPLLAIFILEQDEFYKIPHQIVSTALKTCTDKALVKKASESIFSQQEFYKLPDSIVSTALKECADEALVQKASEEILSQREFYKLPDSIVSTALKECTNEAVVQKASEVILSQQEFYKLPFEIVSTALKECTDEALVKNKSEEILNHQEFYKLPYQIVSTALKECTNEAVAQKASEAILSQQEFYKLPDSIVSTALKECTDEAVVQKASEVILSQQEFYKLPYQIVSTALKECADEVLVKSKSEEILNHQEFYKFSDLIVSTALYLCQNKNLTHVRAKFYLNSWKDKSWNLVFNSLTIFSCEIHPPDFVEEIVNSILNDFFDFQNSNPAKRYRYYQLLKIPFPSIQKWMKASNWVLANWNKKSRALITNVLLAYRQIDVEAIETVCASILENWKHEVTQPIPMWKGKTHYADHIKIALGHPNLKEISKEVAGEIREVYKTNNEPEIPLFLMRIADDILDTDVFPEWRIA